MRYESIAARILLVSTALLWPGVLCSEGRMHPENFPPDFEPASSSNEPAPCPVPFSTSEPTVAAKVQEVQTTLSSLFGNLKYVGRIEPDDVLAYYPLLSELSFVKKSYPDEPEEMLMKWPLPKGNLTLSLLISTDNINEDTLKSLASYIPYISEMSARREAVNYCLDVCAEDSMCFVASHDCILRSVFETGVVSKLKRILKPFELSSELFSVTIAAFLLHFAPAELDKALAEDLDEALAKVSTTSPFYLECFFCRYFISYPTTLWDSDSRQVIFERNNREFRVIPFSDEQRTALSIVNKIKFGAVQDIKNMSEAERKALFDIFCGIHGYALVFHIWAREDLQEDGAWEQFATDLSNTSTLSRLAFGLEGFFQNHFDVTLIQCLDFTSLLGKFKDYPNSSKKERFQTLLRVKVQERSELVLELFLNLRNINRLMFNHLVNFFIDQDDKEGLKALNDFVSWMIDRAPLTELAKNKLSITRICQCLDEGVNGSLRHLAERLGAANVLGTLNFSRLWANDVKEMLRTLGISRKQMDAALRKVGISEKEMHALRLNIGHETAPEDELAVVLWEFHYFDWFWHSSSNRLPKSHALWFYLWKEHREAFLVYVHPNILRHYLPNEPSIPSNGKGDRDVKDDNEQCLIHIVKGNNGLHAGIVQDESDLYDDFDFVQDYSEIYEGLMHEARPSEPFCSIS